MITRILPPAEWHRLPSAHLARLNDLVNPQNVAVVVVEEADEIIACLAALRVTVLEGTWVAPKYRGNAGVMRSLLRNTMSIPAKNGESWAFCAVDSESVTDYVRRLGGWAMTEQFCVVPLGMGV